MKYPPEHKQQVHQKLTAGAAEQLREEGFDALSVAKVMASQGLSKGGFYAHYPSREQLLIEAIEAAFTDVQQAFYQHIEKRTPANWLNKLITRYLSAHHRDDAKRSCPIASLSAEVGRQSKPVKGVFERELKQILELLEKRLHALNSKNPQAEAVALFSMLVGGLQLARSVKDTAYSDQILKNCIESATRFVAFE